MRLLADNSEKFTVILKNTVLTPTRQNGGVLAFKDGEFLYHLIPSGIDAYAIYQTKKRTKIGLGFVIAEKVEDVGLALRIHIGKELSFKLKKMLIYNRETGEPELKGRSKTDKISIKEVIETIQSMIDYGKL